VQKLLVVIDPFYLKLWVKLMTLERIADFQSIFACSASAVTPSEKVQLTLEGSNGKVD